MATEAFPFFRYLRHSIDQSKTRQVYAYILKCGISTTTYPATNPLPLYENHHSFTNTGRAINSVPESSFQSFYTLFNEFTNHNQFGQVIRLSSQMLSQGFLLDRHVLPSVIKACAGLSFLKTAKQVYCMASVSGFGSDSRVLSSLVHMYIKCNRLKDAHKVFDKLSQPDVVAYSALLAGYARKGCIGETMELFSKRGDLGVELNLISWNGMIAGFNHSRHHLDAVIIFQNMHCEEFKPDGTSISSVLSAVGDLKMLDMGFQIHGYVIKQGLCQDKCVVSALIDMYGKFACTMKMSEVFDEMYHMDVGACNALVTGLSRNGLVDKALQVFRRFKDQGMELNVVSWTSIIASCSQNGKDIEALELFREMQVVGVKPNAVTIPCLLPACGNIAALMHGKAAHCFSLKSGISSNVYVGSALVDMYAKCGRIHISSLCFDIMPTRNLVSWNALMAGYAMHGKTKEAISIFQRMQRSGQKPDFVSFISVLSACSQGGKTNEGWSYFNSMSNDYGIEARLEHYACMVNLLGRAGRLQEAYSMIKQMPFEPDACVWGALLSSCRVHNNVSLGEIAAKKLFELEPRNPGNYILLSNIYASKGMWAEVDMLRDKMKSRGLRKNPGCSWIEIKSQVHMLLAGDSSHPQMTLIIQKLAELSLEMRKSGCFPETDFVLQNVDEQDKEQILCGHSEKLAVVLGLLNTSAGSRLQVIKNLRICGDCHAVIKFISSFEQREIFVRDTNRFHHFKDGACSCGDYW
ncbi:pentatricopeptide repeat-containing protein At1g20230 [Ricinus communis]|uniref:pentatricopeptide repeat-containing protein At1g20230 n=1 Tax=Ricinus communis TaxID=3988 RepID=UPI00201AE0B3|nr:pentatricopeptide repeat-containing protein At1g20230 [Ricinus communis]XP_015580477.2 pentatricopeptide repeat-containing protein At1g20230 [Ricinus communis]XP_015580478.2 pentatricopeptide repeat-containing protein At1g20230 [Ricinus communis]XP_025014791.2 pentatricopeptide repeat-containing protein At1g20230 [Ricinus communis]XP_025014792.2 pentatricopeptide repeat-containing protein At1g20230 [Ricinus communis]